MSELAERMAEITISPNEDEVNEAQATSHEARAIEAKRKEQYMLLKAELRRIKFALKEFHDTLLRHGAVPLDLLEELVNEWIAAKRRA